MDKHTYISYSQTSAIERFVCILKRFVSTERLNNSKRPKKIKSFYIQMKSKLILFVCFHVYGVLMLLSEKKKISSDSFLTETLFYFIFEFYINFFLYFVL